MKYGTSFLVIAGVILSGCANTPEPRAKKTEYIPSIEEQVRVYNEQMGTVITVDGRDDPEYDPMKDAYLFESIPVRETVKGSTKKSRILEDGRPDQDGSTAEDESIDDSEMEPAIIMTGKKVGRIPFPMPEYNRLEREGSTVVEGNVYIKGKEDKLFLAKSAKIYLNPVTSYSDQWYSEVYLYGNTMAAADKRLYNHLKFTMSDKNGKFAFHNIPKGEYYITGRSDCGKRCGLKKNVDFYVVGTISVPKEGTSKKNLYLRY